MLKPPTDKITAETREKLLALAEFIEREEKYRLNMSDYVHHSGCGTSCCIAGFVAVLTYASLQKSHFQFFSSAKEHLDISDDQARELFLNYDVRHTNDRTKAVRVLRHFAYTGDVDWSV